VTLIPLAGLFHLEQNIPLALAIVVFSSFGFAAGATIQHLAISKKTYGSAESPSMSMREFFALLTNRQWLAGTGVVIVGASLHAVGLALAPVTVVQPVGILAVPWAVLLAAKLHGYRPTKLIWSAVALTIIGIVSFTYFSASTAVKETELSFWKIVVGVLVVFSIGAVLAYLGMTGKGFRRCLLLASAGSFYYGMSPTMLKTLFEVLGKDHYWTMPLLYVVVFFLLTCYAVGGWMLQQAYANGPAEIVVGSMTTTDPIVAVGFGIAVLGEGARLGVLDAFGMLLTGAIAIGGVVILSKYHPDAQARREAAQASDPVPPNQAAPEPLR
jgi:drug/metabolite transporter (DMT)-like permease